MPNIDIAHAGGYVGARKAHGVSQLSGYKREDATLKQAGIKSATEGRSAISFQAYQSLTEALVVQLPIC